MFLSLIDAAPFVGAERCSALRKDREEIVTIQQPRQLYKSGLTLRWTHMDGSHSCSMQRKCEKMCTQGLADSIYSVKKIRWKIRWKGHRGVNLDLSQDQLNAVHVKRCDVVNNWMSILVCFNQPVCSWFTYATNVFNPWPKRIPVSKSTSLIGSSRSARIMCPNKATSRVFHLVGSLICLYPYICDTSFKTAWLAHELMTFVGGTPKTLRSIFIWKLSISFCSFNVSCKDSKPYRSLLAKVLPKTLIFQVFEVQAWNQSGFSCLAVATTALILCESSWRFSTVSVKVAPKYFAWSFRGTVVPLRSFTEDWCWLMVMFTHLSKFSCMLYLANSNCIARKNVDRQRMCTKDQCIISKENFCIVDARYGC